MPDPIAVAALVLVGVLCGVFITIGFYAYAKRTKTTTANRTPTYPTTARPLQAQESAFVHTDRPKSQSAEDSVEQYERWQSLTNREAEVARLVAGGSAINETAKTMGISPRTVESYLRNVYSKLDVHSRTELANFVRDLTD